jgi:hypothetical protein
MLTYPFLVVILKLYFVWRGTLHGLVNWLIDWLRFYVPLKNFSLIWRRHHYRWRAANFGSMLGAQGHWAERDLYRTTPAVSRDLGFTYLNRRTLPSSFTTYEGMWRIYSNLDPHGNPISRLLRHTRRCGGPILTPVLTGQNIFENTVWISCIDL